MKPTPTVVNDGPLPPPPPSPGLDPERDRLRAMLFGTSPSATRLGRFVVLDELGAGGMGHVYAAYDAQLDRKVAIKVLREELACRAGLRERLLHEAQALARLSHPNVVSVYEASEVDGRVFVAMELVPGQTLLAWQRGEARPWRQVLTRYVDAGRGLAAAHAAGIVHRDFKPDNVLIGDDGRVRVADFGLAFAEGDGAGVTELDDDERERLRAQGDLASTGLSERVTQAGTRLGTPAYMAPEQLRGTEVGPAADQFAFCVALYEALWGERPPLSRAQPPPRRSARDWIPRGVRRAIDRGLGPEPGERHASMDALLEQLVRHLARRRRLGALSIAAGLVTAGVVARPTTPEPCTAAADELLDTWGPRQHDDLRTAFESTGLPFATTAWQSTVTELDAYAQRWSAARVDACEATHIRHVQSGDALDLRIGCLDQRRRDLVALTAALTRADATAVERSQQAVATLPAVERCADLEQLRRDVDPPPSAVQAEVETLRTTLAEVRAARRLGEYAGARRRLMPVVDRARALGYEPLRAEALTLLGTLLNPLGETAAAEATLLEAVDLAEAHHHDELAATAWLELGFVATTGSREPAAGLRWIRRAEAAVRRVKGSPAVQAELYEQRGHLQLLQQRFDDAEQAYDAAMTLREQVFGPEHHAVAATRACLASLYAERGEPVRARAEYERAIASLQATLGEDHPHVGAQRFNLARLELDAGRLDAAGEQLDRVLSMYRRAFGPRAPRLADVLLARAQLEDRRGDISAAMDFAEQARELIVNEPISSVTASATLTMIGTLHYRQQRWGASLSAFQRALETTRATPQPSPLDLALAHSNVGDALGALERWPEAASHYDQARTLMDRVLPANHHLHAYPRHGLGRAALADGRVDEAIEHLRHALALHEANPGDRPEHASAAAHLARALLTSNPSEAATVGEQARVMFEQLGDHARATELQRWLEPLAATHPPTTPETTR